MKSVRRVNPREEGFRTLRERGAQSGLPKSSHGISVADKVNSAEAKVRKEIAIMKKLRHPHVVRLYEVIDDRMREKIYIGWISPYFLRPPTDICWYSDGVSWRW